MARNFINVLDTKELVLDILDSGLANDINVYIGNVHNFLINVANLCKMCMRRGKERERVK